MSKQRLFWLIFSIAIVVAFLVIFLLDIFTLNRQERPPLPLAIVAPLTGEEAASGASLKEGVELAVSRINQSGGIGGRKVTVFSFDDGNNPQQAEQAAREAVKSGALAVIGHTQMATLKVAEPIYKEAGLPLFTLAAHLNAKEMEEKPIANHLLSDETYEIRFLANYLRNVIGEKTVHVLYEDSPRGLALETAFDETMQRFGTRIVYKWPLKSGSLAIKEQAAGAAKELVDGKLPGTVLVIAGPADSARAVIGLRTAGLRNPIAGTQSFSTNSFMNVLKQEWRNSSSLESALTGTMLSTPSLHDVAGEAAQGFHSDFISHFSHAPDWLASIAYDGAHLVLSVLQKNNEEEAMKDDILREQLAELFVTRTKSLPPTIGLNGPIVLNAQGRDIPPPLIGIYDGTDLISTLIQLIPIREEGVSNLMQQFVEGKALYVNDRFMYRTNVVYTGVRPYNISSISLRDGTAEQEFVVWFRWRGDFSPQDVVFSNAVTPIRLDKPENEGTMDGMQYRVYRVKGKFFMDFSSVRRAFDTKVVGVIFNHRLLSRHNLMYVTDVLGMGLTRNTTVQSFIESSSVIATTRDDGIKDLYRRALKAIRDFLHSGSSDSDPLIKLFSNSNLLAGSPGWIIDRAWISQDIMSRSAEGDPKFVGFGRPAPEFSRLEMGTILKPDLIRARDIIPSQHFIYIAVFSFVGAVLAAVLDRRYGKQKWRTNTFLLRVIAWPLLLVSLSNLLLDYALLNATPSTVNSIWMTYQVGIWLVPTILIMIAMERFIWTPIEHRTSRKIPDIIRLLSALVVLILGLIGILANVFEQSITNVLAATGMSAMIVGLAIKDSIANVFAGIIISLEKPFVVGDFIKVGNTIGKVVDITWRTTRIELDAGHVASMPNAKISEAELHNLSRTTTGYSCELKIVVDSDVDPEKVRKLLAAAIDGCPYVMNKTPEGLPDIKIAVKGVANVNQAWLTSYKVSFLVTKSNLVGKSEDYFWPRLWKEFNNSGISWKEGEHSEVLSRAAIHS